VLTWLHLARIYQRLEQRHRELLAEFNLTPAQFDVLSHLANQPGQHQQELADGLLVTKGNVCGLLDRLEQAGLVERTPDPEDRRANLLRLTAAGRECYRAAAPALEVELSQDFKALPEQDFRNLQQALTALDRSLRHQNP
jgi:DNA-binding MarR family transcriptional regulator